MTTQPKTMFTALWSEVLLQQVNDALYGARGSDIPKKDRALFTRQARAYLTMANRDFDNICNMIGLDPDAVRDRMRSAISKAPSPEELAENPIPFPDRFKIERPKGRGRTRRQAADRPGVGSDFGASEGTGGGTTAQERTKITFPTEAGQQ